MGLSKCPPSGIQDALKHLMEVSNGVMEDATLCKIVSPRNDARPQSVKDMPAYDPDAEIHSLALTIPSWINSMERLHMTINPAEVSVNAYRELAEELDNLKSAVETMMAVIKEQCDESERKGI